MERCRLHPQSHNALTGRHVWEYRGTNAQGVTPNVALWEETLGQAGYDKFMAVKWHLPDWALQRSFKKLGPLTGGFLASTKEEGDRLSSRSCEAGNESVLHVRRFQRASRSPPCARIGCDEQETPTTHAQDEGPHALD